MATRDNYKEIIDRYGHLVDVARGIATKVELEGWADAICRRLGLEPPQELTHHTEDYWKYTALYRELRATWKDGKCLMIQVISNHNGDVINGHPPQNELDGKRQLAMAYIVQALDCGTWGDGDGMCPKQNEEFMETLGIRDQAFLAIEPESDDESA